MEEQTGSRAGGHRGENIGVLFRGDRGGIVNISSRMLRWGQGGRAVRRFMDAEKEDMKLVGVREEDTADRVRWS